MIVFINNKLTLYLNTKSDGRFVQERRKFTKSNSIAHASEYVLSRDDSQQPHASQQSVCLFDFSIR